MPATGVHHTDTVDEEWDGPAAVAAMPNEQDTLTYCHAWYDPDGDRDAKDTYKFPHAKTMDGPANLSACRNGLSRLDSADIPEGDKDKVRSHLQAHLDDADDEDADSDGGDAKNAVQQPARPRGMQRAPVLNKQGSGYFSITNRPRNAATGEVTADVYIYDEIGWFGTSAQSFINELRDLDATALTVHINSPGGDAWDGIAIYNALVGFDGRVDVIVDSMAASAASVIAMAGDTVTMAAHSQMMIHDASGLCIGNAADMREMAELLGKQSDNIAGVYAARAGGEVADWRGVMEGEAWYTADEAVEAGLADKVRAPRKRAESSEDEPEATGDKPEDRWDLSVFAYAGRSAAPSPPKPPANRAGNTSNPTKEGDAVSTLSEGLRERLGCDADASEDTLLAALDEVLAEQTDPTEGDPPPVDPEQQPEGAPQGAGEQQPVAASLNLPDGMVVIDSATLDELRAGAQRGNEMWQQSQDAARRTVVENAINDGQIPPSRRDYWNNYMQHDEDGAKQILAQIPKNSIPVSELGHGQSPQNQATDDGWFDSVPAPKHTQGA